MSGENEIQEEKTDAQEQYENWKQNIPFMYEICISHQNPWPSLTVQWLKEVENDQNDNEIHRLLCSTLTDGSEPDSINLMKVSLPKSIDEHVDYTLLNNIWKAQQVGKVYQEMSIPVESAVNRIRSLDQTVFAAQLSDHNIGIQYGNQASMIQNLVQCLKGQEDEGYGLSWNPNNHGWLLSGSYDKKVYHWDIHGELIRKYTYHDQQVEDVCWHPQNENIFISCSDDHTFAMQCFMSFRCDIRTPKGMQIQQVGHASEINCIQFNPLQPNYFATGGADSDVKMFDLNKPESEIHTFSNHDQAIYTLQWSPHKKNLLASGSEDSKIIIWDIYKIGNEIKAEDEKDGPAELLFYHGGHRSRVHDLSWNPKHKNLIASVEQEKSQLQIWKTQPQLWEEDENDEYIQSVIN